MANFIPLILSKTSWLLCHPWPRSALEDAVTKRYWLRKCVCWGLCPSQFVQISGAHALALREDENI